MSEEQRLNRAARWRNSRVLHYTVSTLAGVSFFLLFMLPVSWEHEVGHSLAAKAYGIPVYQITPSYTLLGNIVNPTARTVILFSGGLDGFLFSMLLISWAYFSAHILRAFLKERHPVFARNLVQRSLWHPWTFVEGAYVGFLALGFTELFGAFWEAFFNDSYIIRSALAILGLLFVSGVLASMLVFIRARKHYHFAQNF